MAFKSVLTVATETKFAAQTLQNAAQICALDDAHLDILALAIDRVSMGYSYIGAGIEVLQIAQEQLADRARQLTADLTGLVVQERADLRVAVETAVAQVALISDLVAQRARFADLVVLPQPYNAEHKSDSEAVLEAALFEGQAPVLVLPTQGLATMPPRTVVIAWNQAREALNAVRAALPLLKQADRVIITVVDPSPHGAERSDPGGLLCQMLVRHGVKAEVAVLARSLPRVSDVLARQIRDVNADLLVMGAYGHSRFREAILGGATRHMLETAQVPVLMAH